MKQEDFQLDQKDLSILCQVAYKENIGLLHKYGRLGEYEEEVEEKFNDLLVNETMRLVKCIAKVRQKHRAGMSKLNKPAYKGEEFVADEQNYTEHYNQMKREN